MNLEDLQEYALIAEIICVIAIVISLVFVGIEVNQNTEINKISIYQAMVELSHDRMMRAVENPEIVKLSIQSENDGKQLDLVDKIRLMSYKN